MHERNPQHLRMRIERMKRGTETVEEASGKTRI